MRIKLFFPLLVSILLLASCSPGPAVTPTPTGGIHLPVQTNPPSSTAVVNPTETHIPVDLTPAQLAAINAVAKKANVPADQVHLVSTEAVTWPDGCLGVVLPGVMCTQGQVEGFKIKLEARGMQFEFHTNQDGTSVVDAAQQLASLRFVVYTAEHTIQVVNPSLTLGPTYNPAFNGLNPTGGTIAGTAYIYDNTDRPRLLAVSESGQQELTFAMNPTYGVAVWRGGLGTQPRLAWGTQLSTDAPSSLEISAPDGSQFETLLTLGGSANPPMQIVAQLWSADGQSLYFSKEPVGLGGYILFAGASNLFKIDLATKKVTELIADQSASGVIGCLDAISGDYRFVAEACTQGVLTVRDLTTGSTATVTPPPGSEGFNLIGSTRFSPDGTHVVYAMAKGNPDAEQGLLAIADSTGGGSKVIFKGEESAYYTIAGWLDDQTLLIQNNPLACANCSNQLLTIKVDGSARSGVARGSFLAVIDSR